MGFWTTYKSADRASYMTIFTKLSMNIEGLRNVESSDMAYSKVIKFLHQPQAVGNFGMRHQLQTLTEYNQMVQVLRIEIIIRCDVFRIVSA